MKQQKKVKWIMNKFESDVFVTSAFEGDEQFIITQGT